MVIDRASADNNYFCTSILSATPDGEILRRKDAFVRLAVLVLDDVQLVDVQTFSYAIQTSPGKYQIGILLDPEDQDTYNRQLVDRVMSSLAARGRSNDASGNACVRYVRLPIGSNTKARAAGPWQVKMEIWQPSIRWSLDDACSAVGIDLDFLRQSPELTKTKQTKPAGENHAGEMILGLTDPNPASRVYHENITRLAASLISGGMYPGAAVDFLYSVMDEVRPSEPEQLARWKARREEIPRAVKSAEKFAPEDRQPAKVTINLGGSPVEPEQAASSLLIDLQELQSKAGSIKWQVKHMVPEDSLGMFFGASGTYKSFIALDHCLHVANGMQWMGRKTKQGGVVYVAAEGGAGIYRRVQAWHQAHQMSLTPNFHVCTTPLVLSLSEHVEALASAIKALPIKPSLIYIDTLSQTFEGDENSANDISTYLRLINSTLRAQFNCTVIVIHHTGHSASERPRGSSAITANVDFMLGIYKPEGTNLTARVDVVKQKDGDKLTHQVFTMNRVVLGQDEDGEEISSLSAEHNDSAAKILSTATQKLNANEQIIMSIVMNAGSHIMDKDLRHAFYNALGQDSLKTGKTYNQESAKKAYYRAYNSLQAKQMLQTNSTGMVYLKTGEQDE
jgi:hypothetical protein